MRYELRIQDPTNPPRSPLFDVVVELSQRGEVEYLRLFFGFLTGSGMDALLAVPRVVEVLRTAQVDFLVGLDAVTDRAGLERLLELSRQNGDFHPAVIKNTTGALIHPKMLFARYTDGTSVAVVGSNNLSFGGLNGNVEGYTVASFDSGEAVDLADWDAFVDRWGALINEIDEEALAAAERNEHRLDRLRLAAKEATTPAETGVVLSDGQAHEAPAANPADLEEAMLVAQIPKASDRWPQIHYSAEIIQDYFDVGRGDHVYLREFDGVDVEDRQVVYSTVNKNYKIELGAAGEAQRAGGYPAVGRPVVVFRRESGALRRHRYVFLMPGEDGHTAMAELASAEFQGPSNQVPRVVVPRNRVLAAWPECPL
jgi:hypothetical protein